jgi:predicted PurR-regulated permease PerM
LVIGLPYAFILGLMATVLTMIPFLGAITTCVAALLVGFASSGDWVLPVKVLGVFATVQSLEGLVISPKIMGDRTDPTCRVINNQGIIRKVHSDVSRQHFIDDQS